MMAATESVDVIVVGDPNVGKTCIMNRFTEQSYSHTHVATVGVDFKVKQFDVGGRKVKLQIWDTAGMEKFNTLTTSWYRRADGVLLCYDLTDAQTFDRLRNWLDIVHQNCARHVNLLLVGNKRDRIQHRRVSQLRASQLASEIGADYLETSAQDNVNIDKAFHDLAQAVLARRKAEAESGTLMRRVGSSESFQLVLSRQHSALEASLNTKSMALLHEQRRLDRLQAEHEQYLRQHTGRLLDYDTQIAECASNIARHEKSIREIEREQHAPGLSLSDSRRTEKRKKCPTCAVV